MFSTADGYTPIVRTKKGRLPDDSPEYPLTPVELDLGALSMIATLPDPAISTPTTMRLRGLPFVTPEQSAWQRPVYLPGNICLRSSFTTDINLLQHSTATSDDAVLDEIVDFFLSFGLSDLD